MRKASQIDVQYNYPDLDVEHKNPDYKKVQGLTIKLTF